MSTTVPGFTPIGVCEVELSDQLPAIERAAESPARLLRALSGHPHPRRAAA